MSERKQTENEALVESLLSGPLAREHRGKRVAVIGGQAHILPEEESEAAARLRELEEQYPDEILHVVSVADRQILGTCEQDERRIDA